MFLELTQFGEPYSLATLLMRLSGRVAEYVLLSLPGGVCHQHHAVHALIDVLDSAILGDVTHRTHKGVHQLTSCTRGSKEMGSFLMDFQLRCQMLAGLGKHIDENVLGTMLLNQANMFDLDRKLLMAQTGRSKAYSEIYDSNNITPSSRPPPFNDNLKTFILRLYGYPKGSTAFAIADFFPLMPATRRGIVDCGVFA